MGFIFEADIGSFDVKVRATAETMDGRTIRVNELVDFPGKIQDSDVRIIMSFGYQDNEAWTTKLNLKALLDTLRNVEYRRDNIDINYKPIFKMLDADHGNY